MAPNLLSRFGLPVGALDDNPGTSITNPITMLAAVLQCSQFADGRGFRLIEHHPGATSLPTLWCGLTAGERVMLRFARRQSRWNAPVNVLRAMGDLTYRAAARAFLHRKPIERVEQWASASFLIYPFDLELSRHVPTRDRKNHIHYDSVVHRAFFTFAHINYVCNAPVDELLNINAPTSNGGI